MVALQIDRASFFYSYGIEERINSITSLHIDWGFVLPFVHTTSYTRNEEQITNKTIKLKVPGQNKIRDRTERNKL